MGNPTIIDRIRTSFENFTSDGSLRRWRRRGSNSTQSTGSTAGTDRKLKIVCLSDTHGHHNSLLVPHGDVLIHCGDFTNTGRPEEICRFNDWLGRQPHKHKIVIAGNHETTFHPESYEKNWQEFHRTKQDPAMARKLLTNCVYLEDDLHVIDGRVRVYGSPWTPTFHNWAFMADEAEIEEKWSMIPQDVDILLTHGPPSVHGGITVNGKDNGCAHLLDHVRRVAPKYHVFGHIHEGFGVTNEGCTTFINASTCTHEHKPSNPPITFYY